jgi:hypothetical protein
LEVIVKLKDTFEDIMSRQDKSITRRVAPWGPLKDMQKPFRAAGRWVMDARGKNVCEADPAVAGDIAKALNEISAF